MRAPSTKFVQLILKFSNFGPFFGPFSAVNLKKAIPHPTVRWSVSEVIERRLGVRSVGISTFAPREHQLHDHKTAQATGTRQILSSYYVL